MHFVVNIGIFGEKVRERFGCVILFLQRKFPHV